MSEAPVYTYVWTFHTTDGNEYESTPLELDQADVDSLNASMERSPGHTWEDFLLGKLTDSSFSTNPTDPQRNRELPWINVGPCVNKGGDHYSLNPAHVTAIRLKLTKRE